MGYISPKVPLSLQNICNNIVYARADQNEVRRGEKIWGPFSDHTKKNTEKGPSSDAGLGLQPLFLLICPWPMLLYTVTRNT